MRILICEDETIVRVWLRRELTRQGFEVVGESRDGESAVEMAARLEPDLILMDIKMPVRDGLSASEEILRRRPVPIVMLTAYGERESVERSVDAGVSGYLVKPVEGAQLGPAIVLASARFEDLMSLRGEVESLETALQVRKLLDRAKGILIRSLGLDEPGAHQVLQRLSSRERIPLKDAALRVIQRSEAGKLTGVTLAGEELGDVNSNRSG